jgi:hypothetical protein
MVNKLRAGSSRQDDLAEAENITAVFDLAASALLDRDLLGPALILLATRNCHANCPSDRRQHRHRDRDRDYGPID